MSSSLILLPYVITAFFFIVGCVIGSFLNVVSLRYNTGLSIAKGRSRCFSCSKDLRWFELVPVVSYICLGGKCARCKSKISIQYILVELATGIVFSLIYLKFQYLASSQSSLPVFLLALVYYFFIAGLFTVIFVYDLKHKIIPDKLVIILAVLTLLRLCIAVPNLWGRGALSDILAGPALALPFALLWLVSRGRWMGLGDAKLALPIGWMLGLSRGISAIVFAFWIGAAVSIILIIVQKFWLPKSRHGLTMKSEIPFAPFLIIGLAIVFFTGATIMSISLSLAGIWGF